MPLRHESRQKIPAVLGMWAVAARVCCFLLPRLRRNRSRTQKWLPGGSYVCRPNLLGRQSPRNKRVCVVSFFGGVKHRRSYTPVGAEWDAIAIRMSPCAFRWVRKRIQIRSETFPMHPDVCGMGQNMQPQIPIHVGSIWITVASHWTQTGRHAAILTGRPRTPGQAWRNVCSG